MNNAVKKQITKVWLEAFPDLSEYAQNKLYKTIGPFIVGLELINIPRSEDYRPHFVLYPLYKTDLKSCLKYPVLIYEFYDKKRLQLDLPYSDPRCLYEEAQKDVRKGLRIEFDTDVLLSQLFNLVDECISEDVSIKNSSGRKASMLEIKFHAALYTGDYNQIQALLTEIQIDSKNWNMQNFEVWRGNFDKWLNGLQHTIDKRDSFMKQIELNKQDKKIVKLKSSNIIL